MRVLVTGIDGYIGSVLGPYLARAGHDVTGLDTGFYRAGLLYEDGEDRLPTRTRDIRATQEADLGGFEAVVHLAELSNDPLGAHRPGVTFDINSKGSMTLARAARAAGVGRFIYFSSCSVYGIAGDEVKTEASVPAPKTAYAECKVLCERELAGLCDKHFVTVCLRNATAFGASPRMRFDIVLNNLAGLAWTTRELVLTSDGTPWRPLVHVLDICQAVELALAAPAETICGEIFNVGDDIQNYQVRDIANIVAGSLDGCTTSFGPPDADNRSYRVSFSKIRDHLPDFRCRWPAERGAEQLMALFRALDMTRDVFMSPPFTRLKQLQVLLETGQIDDNFYWTNRRERSASATRSHTLEESPAP